MLFLISRGGCDEAGSISSSILTAGDKADTGVIDTKCGAVDAMRLKICFIDCWRNVNRGCPL